VEGSTAPTDKAAWRRWARSRRSGVVVDGGAVVGHLDTLLAGPRPPGWVVTYWPMAHEIDLRPLRAGPQALTRTPAAGHDLTLHPAEAPLEEHRWGFRQPVADAVVIEPGEVGVVLVPGLVFDRHGARLGHGAGYYDRLLARLRPEVWRIGVVPEALVVDRLPAEAHDIPMTHLVTEAGVIVCRS
jgi:5-formyltetrahydrofolate cyclo-ligase